MVNEAQVCPVGRPLHQCCMATPCSVAAVADKPGRGCSRHKYEACCATLDYVWSCLEMDLEATPADHPKREWILSLMDEFGK